MFVTTDRYTINTDTINYAEESENGDTILHFNNGDSISVPTVEARAIFTSLIPRLEWGTPPQQDS
jgi:hypothetical protein